MNARTFSFAWFGLAVACLLCVALWLFKWARPDKEFPPQQPSVVSLDEPEATPPTDPPIDASAETRQVEWARLFAEVGIELDPSHFLPPETEVEDTNLVLRVQSDEEVLRQWRGRETARFLNSPARSTPECQEIEGLCREYGYGPWAVAAAYNIAYENFHGFRMEYVDPSITPERLAVFLLTQADRIDRAAREEAARLGIDWDPVFLDRVKQVPASVFIGQYSPPPNNPREELLHDLKWEELGRFPTVPADPNAGFSPIVVGGAPAE